MRKKGSYHKNRPFRLLAVLIRCTPEERREPAGQRCAYARRCPAGVAAPLGCVIFFASAEIAVCTSCAQGFPHVWGRGGITTLSALCVLLKYRTAACQNGSFAVFWGQVGVVPRTIPIFLRIRRIFCWQFQLQTLLRYGTISSANWNLLHSFFHLLIINHKNHYKRK